MEAYYSIIQKENEYRILLTPVDTGVLPERIQQVLAERDIDISLALTTWLVKKLVLCQV